jgi:hypothetical protein
VNACGTAVPIALEHMFRCEDIGAGVRAGGTG